MSLNWLNRRIKWLKSFPLITHRKTIQSLPEDISFPIRAFQEQIRNAKISTSQEKNKKPVDGKEDK